MGQPTSTDGAIIELLDHYLTRVSETATMRLLREVAADWHRWSEGHAVFDRIREKTLEAEHSSDRLASNQYAFEEICAKTLYNMSNPEDPFDSDSAFWILPLAANLSAALGETRPERVYSLLHRDG